MNPLFAFLLGLMVSTALAPFSVRFCKIFGITDKPSERKLHSGQVPLAGGMLLVAAIVSFCLLAPSLSSVTFAILVTAPVLFLIGVADDRVDIAARRRLLVQSFIGLALALGLGVRVTALDSVFTGTPLILGFGISVVFSVICFCGVLNAANMADGIDGLLGVFASLSLLGIAWLTFQSGNHADLGFVLVLLGALGGYLAFNLGVFGEKYKIFLGDSGSLVIGLSLFVLLVSGASPEAAAFTPTSAGWLLGVPLMDTVSVMFRRIMQRRSPFQAGRDHLHHLLLDMGFSRLLVLGILAVFHMSLVGTGVSANYSGVSQAIYFWVFVGLTVSITLFSALIQKSGILAEGSKWKSKSAPIPSERQNEVEPNPISVIDRADVFSAESAGTENVLVGESKAGAKKKKPHPIEAT